MPEIQIRPAIAADIPLLIKLDHHNTSDHAWQIEFHPERDQGQIMVHFRQVRLPRPARVEYPRSPHSLAEDWDERSGVLVALLNERPIGYASLMLGRVPFTTWVSDLVVAQSYRRQGIGSALILAASEWAQHMESRNLVLEMQPRNYPAIRLAYKMGFEFCGYNDFYYANHEIGIFFGKPLL
jgi:GNAT superfamily N-acetyltransferase